jgi:hypothetical protein
MTLKWMGFGLDEKRLFLDQGLAQGGVPGKIFRSFTEGDVFNLSLVMLLILGTDGAGQ